MSGAVSVLRLRKTSGAGGCAGGLRRFWGRCPGAVSGGSGQGVSFPRPAPSRNRGSAPDPAPQAPEGLSGGPGPG
ncbi:hypothetical protein EOT10_36015 [Streptomyces antnestii]|uniref:Uncharacterized protein n=1 Tax=Streptomyces antnestii TaxID=2494256 RepID=A0A3S2YQQ9_9ACTN|nr:hypothetical protein EOT10_36015 [Streptomyces sp. San01]